MVYRLCSSRLYLFTLREIYKCSCSFVFFLTRISCSIYKRVFKDAILFLDTMMEGNVFTIQCVCGFDQKEVTCLYKDYWYEGGRVLWWGVPSALEGGVCRGGV